MRDRLAEIPTDRPIWLFCGVGLRGYLASCILRNHGYRDVRNLIGGLRTYRAATTQVETPEGFAAPTASCTTCTPLPGGDAGGKVIQVDACGIGCPGPILKMKQAMDQLQAGQRVEVKATDAGFLRDAQAWCRSTGNRLLGKHSEGGVHTVEIEKTVPAATAAEKTQAAGAGKTFILFSDDLDKALATFVLANGAAATGQKVSIFFTFWGLNAIKKRQKPQVRKDVWGRMFSWMLPSDSTRLALSKMNMLGIGARLMRYLMTKKGVDSLESLRQQAIESGVEFIACQMSMDVMGICREELLDNVTVGGVASYMERAEQADVNLFI